MRQRARLPVTQLLGLQRKPPPAIHRVKQIECNEMRSAVLFISLTEAFAIAEDEHCRLPAREHARNAAQVAASLRWGAKEVEPHVMRNRFIEWCITCCDKCM
jgi:hypothetical protein